LYKHGAKLPNGPGLRMAQTTFATTGTEAQSRVLSHTKFRLEETSRDYTTFG